MRCESPVAVTGDGRGTAQNNDSALSGRVFDIKRFALHDGPGIRTTVFLKGCPLACTWCQNPEGIPLKRLVMYHPDQCIRCERCVAACKNGAISTCPGERRFIHIDRSRCECDGSCIEACPTGALRWDSTEYTPEQILREVRRDEVFYRNSGGGVTLSGGEPLAQAQFAREVLRLCRDAGLHTAIETTLHTTQEVLGGILPLVDLFLSDIKLWDAEEHRRYTGVDNRIILENVKFLAREGASMLIRVPLIPETTTSPENIAAIARFVRDLPGEHSLELLNFNPLAAGKYQMLEKPYPYEQYTTQLPAEQVEALREIVRTAGVTAV